MLKQSGRLAGVDVRLQKVTQVACTLLPFDVILSEGVRSVERQRDLYAQGRTRPGKKVTWTMDSPHIKGLAVDLYPNPQPGERLEDVPLSRYSEVAAAMFKAAETVGVRIRWGADWDMDGVPRERGESDNPHFELAE